MRSLLPLTVRQTAAKARNHAGYGRPAAVAGCSRRRPKSCSWEEATNDTMRCVAEVISHNPPKVYPPYAGYAHAVEVPPGARTLFVSGLNGYERDGRTMPTDFAGQANLVWRHLGALLSAANMSYNDLVSLRFFLASAADDPTNVALIREHLGDHRSCRTVVVQQLLEPNWLVEIEAIAAKLDD